MKPILFSADMVRAILDGRKTMTRRVVKLRPGEDAHESDDGLSLHAVLTICGSVYEREIKPRYQLGDILWVRETWSTTDRCGLYPNWPSTGEHFMYRADAPESPEANDARWFPSIHMPKRAARLFLRVTDVQAERVQEISEADAVREGCKMPRVGEHVHDGMELRMICTAQDAFAALWDSLNAKRAGGVYAWERNPWVWVYGFERIGREEAAEEGGVQCAGK